MYLYNRANKTTYSIGFFMKINCVHACQVLKTERIL